MKKQPLFSILKSKSFSFLNSNNQLIQVRVPYMELEIESFLIYYQKGYSNINSKFFSAQDYILDQKVIFDVLNKKKIVKSTLNHTNSDIMTLVHDRMNLGYIFHKMKYNYTLRMYFNYSTNEYKKLIQNLPEYNFNDKSFVYLSVDDKFYKQEFITKLNITSMCLKITETIELDKNYAIFL